MFFLSGFVNFLCSYYNVEHSRWCVLGVMPSIYSLVFLSKQEGGREGGRREALDL